MSILQVFFLQITLAFVAFILVAKVYVFPKLKSMPLYAALTVLAFTHIFRFLGLVFLVPGVVSPELPTQFASQTAYGDLLTTILALITIFFLLRKSKTGIVMAWIYNIVGAVDLLNAFYKGYTQMNGEFQLLGAGWYIPTLIVPGLLVSHFVALKLLARGEPKVATIS